MDVVYILGKGSLSQNEEIRYSLRSLEKNMLDLRNVYIIGEDPGFLKDIHHIPAVDPFPKAWQNALYKIRLACDIEDLSEEFLLMNDDFFMLELFSGAEFPSYSLNRGDGGNSGSVNFAVHCPYRIEKKYFSHLPLTPLSKTDYSPRTFYLNFYRAIPTPIKDIILRHGDGMPSYADQTKGQPFFSTCDDTFLREDFLSWLSSEYPTPSRFEIS